MELMNEVGLFPPVFIKEMSMFKPSSWKQI